MSQVWGRVVTCLRVSKYMLFSSKQTNLMQAMNHQMTLKSKWLLSHQKKYSGGRRSGICYFLVMMLLYHQNTAINNGKKKIIKIPKNPGGAVHHALCCCLWLYIRWCTMFLGRESSPSWESVWSMFGCVCEVTPVTKCVPPCSHQRLLTQLAPPKIGKCQRAVLEVVNTTQNFSYYTSLVCIDLPF